MDERDREGTAATLRAAALIVIVGIALGLAFNAAGLASRPNRGLPWITQPERMPSLEELQPASGPVPAAPPRARPGFSLVGAAWAGGLPVRGAPARSVGPTPAPKVTPADSARTAVKRAPAPKTARAVAKPTRAPVQPAKVATQPVRPAVQRTGTTPPAAVKPDLPVVPDLDQPIEVKLANVKKFFDAGPAAAVIVDAREAVEYEAGHIAGARCLPFDDAAAKPELLEPFKHLGRPIILYCSGGDCELSKDLAKSMLAEGIRKVLVFTDGYPAWQAAGYPVEKGAAGAKR
jgi:rhodanese-related sulfurtransferase